MTLVYLHIGAPKTGSTYLQQILWRHRRQLARDGVSYPGAYESAHFDAALDLRGIGFGGVKDSVTAGAWDRLVSAAIDRRRPRSLISHELLAGSIDSAIDRAATSLKGHEVHVIYSARDLARQIPASWQESVKNGRTLDFEDFCLALTRARRRGHAARTFWRQQDAAAVLARWSRHVPRARIHLLTIPPAESPPDLLWRRFASIVGLDPAHYDWRVEQLNDSLGFLGAELLRRTNLALGQRLPWPGYGSVVKFGFVDQHLAPVAAGPRARVPERWQPWLEGRSKHLVDDLAGAGYDVVGDLADLTPVPAAPPKRPHHVTPAQSRALDIAAASLANLLVDQAGDHHHYPAWLRRLARRLPHGRR